MEEREFETREVLHMIDTVNMLTSTLNGLSSIDDIIDYDRKFPDLKNTSDYFFKTLDSARRGRSQVCENLARACRDFRKIPEDMRNILVDYYGIDISKIEMQYGLEYEEASG